MTNVFTPAAIEAGDVVIRILTPDLKGINYLKAHQPLLVDERFRFSEHMTFAGLARPFHALAGLTACFPTVRRSTAVLLKAVCSRLSPTVTPNTLLH